MRRSAWQAFRITSLSSRIDSFSASASQSGGNSGKVWPFQPSLVVATHVEDVHLAVVSARDRFVFLDALKFALVRAVVIEGPAIHYFDRAEFAQDVPRQPHFAVASAADAPQQFVVGNARRWSVGVMERWSVGRADSTARVWRGLRLDRAWPGITNLATTRHNICTCLRATCRFTRSIAA